MKNVLMLDLETTGSVPGCCILTLGASGLDKDGGSVEFYKRIAHYRSKSDGFLDEAKTLEWWEKQDESIRFEAFSGRDNPEEVINEFLGFIDENFSVTAKSFSVWCKGQDFDFPILKRYFERYGHECPWAFWQQRDYRTIQAMSSLIKRHENNQGAHSALEDAKAQMRGLEYFWSLKQLDLLKELDNANCIKEERRWRKCSDELPKYDEYVFAFCPDYGSVEKARLLEDGEWRDSNWNFLEVTHWMPMPKAPETAEKCKEAK